MFYFLKYATDHEYSADILTDVFCSSRTSPRLLVIILHSLYFHHRHLSTTDICFLLPATELHLLAHLVQSHTGSRYFIRFRRSKCMKSILARHKAAAAIVVVEAVLLLTRAVV